MSLVRSCAVRMQRTFSLSHSPQAWQERAGLGLLIGGGCLLYFVADRLSIAPFLLLGSLLLAALLILVRQRWLSVVGPVLRYEMLRSARRSRFTLYRIYAYFILVLVAFSYVVWYAQSHWDQAAGGKHSASFGQGFFYSFVALQTLTVLVMTPGYLAGVFTEEKERRTMEYLLATDLRNREIILGKIGARLANLLLMLMTGLPIASFLEFMGGVDPELVLAGFVVAVITAVSLGSLSGLTSVYAPQTRSALVRIYLAMTLYLVLSVTSYSLYVFPLATWGLTLGNVSLNAKDVLDWFNAGNPFLQMLLVFRDVAMGGRFSASLAYHLEVYATFHGVLAAACLAWATLRLRAVALRQADQAPSRLRWRLRLGLRPRLRDRAMIWKEVFVEGGLRLGSTGLVLLAVCVAGSFLSFYYFLYILSPYRAVWQYPYVVSYWSAIMGCVVACLLLLGVAIRASTSLSGERDRHTLDGLLAAPLATTEILFAKWLGSILGLRWGFLWLGAIWILGFKPGAWQGVTVVMLPVAWVVYAGFLAVVGLWFSLMCRSSLRATVYTLASTVLMWVIFLVPADLFFPPDRPAWVALARRVYQFQLALSPPAALSYHLTLLRPAAEVPAKNPLDFQAGLWGLVIWTAAGVALWFWTRTRFRKATGRL